MVLLSHQGYPVEEIARITCRSDETVRRWLHRFLRRGCPGLREAPHPGRPPKITPLVEQLLRQWAALSPRRPGIPRPAWTTENLARLVEDLLGIAVTPECIRQHRHRLNFVCRRPTWTVEHRAQEQPGYARKKGR
jgi:transposase